MTYKNTTGSSANSTDASSAEDSVASSASRRRPAHHNVPSSGTKPNPRPAEGSRPDTSAVSGAPSSKPFAKLGLSPAALAAVDDLGYEAPTPVQEQAIPLVLSGRDVMAAAQTGTGKTAAFLLPALDRLDHVHPGEGPHMLVITPTRELAQQIEDVARVVCTHTGHTCASVVGGVGYEPQRSALAKGCDLLIATPGRLLDLMSEGSANLARVQTLVLDEADRMLDMGFLPSVRKIVAKTPANRQTLLFSATLSDDVLEHTHALVSDPARVEIAPKGTAAETIDQYCLGMDPRAKVSVLLEILRREGSKRVIVFCRGKHRADAIARKLRKAGVNCAPIHGDRTQSQRTNALRRFSSGEIDVLVATDVLARGIDIADVAYVVNLDVPSDAQDYIHRIGRTGRAGEYGWALTFVTEDEYLDLRDIEKLMGKIIPPYEHASGIDLGEDAFVPDPARNPSDALPGKRMRKKLQMERERAREKKAAAAANEGKRKSEGSRGLDREGKATDELGGESGSARSGGSKRVSSGAGRDAGARQRSSQRFSSGSRTKSQSSSASAERPTRASVHARPANMSAFSDRSSAASRTMKPTGKVASDRTSPAPRSAKPRRHPGDHGGMDSHAGRTSASSEARHGHRSEQGNRDGLEPRGGQGNRGSRNGRTAHESRREQPGHTPSRTPHEGYGAHR